MKYLGAGFDMVIVDAPPVGIVIDAAEIAKSCDGSVLVLAYNKTRIRALQDAYHQMSLTGTPVLGCILNKVALDRLSTKKYYYKYGDSYTDRYENNKGFFRNGGNIKTSGGKPRA